jgi:hypothetical protein
MLALVAFAIVPVARTVADDPRLLLAGVYLAGALLVGALLIALIQRWRRRQDKVVLTPEQQLSAYRTLYERGALSQEEFERLRSLLGREMKPEKPAPGPAPAKKESPPEVPPDGIRPE